MQQKTTKPTRYRLTCEDMDVIGRAAGTLWERPITDDLLRDRLPDVSQNHLPLSDCHIGTLEYEVIGWHKNVMGLTVCEFYQR